MKLIQTMKRTRGGGLKVTVEHDYPNRTWIKESAVERQIGPRPWSEVSYTEKESGKRVVIYYRD